MISDARIDELASDNVICVVSWDERIAMAREIQAYRQAFSEPVACVYFDSYYGYQASFVKAIDLKGGELLYRKPTIPNKIKAP